MNTLQDDYGDTGVLQLPHRGLTFRPARPSDAASCFACAFHYHPTPSLEQLEHLFTMSCDSGSLFVAMDGNLVAGFACGLVLPHAYSGQPYLHIIAIFVRPGWRKTWALGGLLRSILRWYSTQPLEMVTISAPVRSGLGTILVRLGFTLAESVYVRTDGNRAAARRSSAGRRQPAQEEARPRIGGERDRSAEHPRQHPPDR